MTRLAHQSRFNRVLKLLDNRQYHCVLDYGCGDGWLLKTAWEKGVIQSGFGVDIAPHMLLACQEIFSETQDFQFCQPDAMASTISPNSCDLLLCTETLEHVGNAEATLAQMLQYCRVEAKIIISVPIEIGPSLLLKQLGRYLANLKGRYGYERYTLPELFAATILWDAACFPSSHSENAEMRSHKGFDYRTIEKLLNDQIAIERTFFSPFSSLGKYFNSTIFFVGRKR